MKIEDLSILVVDDSLTMRILLKKFLESAGVKSLYEADCGEQAMEVLKGIGEKPLHLIVSDWNMGPGNGLEFLKRLKSNEIGNYQNTPFIMVTCEVERGQVELAFENGAVNYIAKPFSKSILIEKITKTMEKQLMVNND